MAGGGVLSCYSPFPASVRLWPTCTSHAPQAIGTDPKQEGVRPYTTSIAHGVHCDNSDIVALLCIRDALAGGLTLWASSVAVHNELLRRGRRVRAPTLPCLRSEGQCLRGDAL